MLAEALNVPAVQLIYPNVPEGDCEFLPGQHSIAWQALRRFTGETAVPGQPAMSDEREYHLSLMRELDTIPNKIEQIEDGLSKARLDLAEAEAQADLGGVAHQERMVQILVGSIESWMQRDLWIRKTLKNAGFEISLPEEKS